MIRAPAGLYRGWWVLLALGLVAFSRVAFFNPVLGIFIQPLQDEFGWSRATIAGALTVGTLLGALAVPFVGPLIDRYGSRYFTAAAIAILGILLALLSAVEEVWQFYGLYAFGRAIAVGVLEIALVATVANWFIRRRGRAMGLLSVGTRAGMALTPLVVLLFISLFDWRAAFLALGVLIVVVALVPSWRWIRRRPEDLGLRPDGDPPAARLATAAAGAAHDPRWTVGEAIRTRPFWLLLIGSSALMFVNGAVNLSMASHLGDNGIGRGTAITVITLWAVMGMVGGVVGGELRERVAIRLALSASVLFLSGGIVMLLAVQNVWMAFLFAIAHGLAFGALLPLLQVVFADYFGRWSVGAIRGVTAPVQFGVNALGPLAATLVFDSRGSYDLIFVVFVLLALAAALLFLFARPPVHRATESRAATRST